MALEDTLAPAKVELREGAGAWPTKGVRHATTCDMARISVGMSHEDEAHCSKIDPWWVDAYLGGARSPGSLGYSGLGLSH